MAVICLTLNPLGNDVMANHMNSWCTQDGKTHIPVLYRYQTIDSSEGTSATGSIQEGADLLDQMITDNIAVGNTIYVFAHSKGCQVIGRWFIKYGAASGHSTNDLKFVTSGNLCNSLTPDGAQPSQKFKFPTTPQGGFNVIDIARENDGWARWKDTSGNIFILFSNISGMCSNHESATYSNVHLNSAGVPTDYQSTSTSGTTTYYTVD